MRRFDEISIGPNHLVIDRYPMRWWSVRAFLDLVHAVTRCRGCWWLPVFNVQMRYLNTKSRVTFTIPVDQELRVRLAESYGITLRQEEDPEAKYPWMEYLSDADRETFLEELLDADGDAVEMLVEQWKNTADIMADPELYKALTERVDDE